MDDDERKRTKVFATWLLNIGNGECGEPDEEDTVDTSWITIPSEYCVSPNEQGITELINFIYDAATLKNPTAIALQEKTIVYPKNEIVECLCNVTRMMKLFQPAVKQAKRKCYKDSMVRIYKTWAPRWMEGYDDLLTSLTQQAHMLNASQKKHTSKKTRA
nr:DNA helicase [Tanacetum cinerariifolium]